MKRLLHTGLIAFALWFFGLLAFIGSSLVLQPETPDAKTDAVIVVTGGNNRIKTGIDLLQNGAAPLLLISGVHKYYKSNDMLGNWDIPPHLKACCITLDFEATNTIENAEQIKLWRAKQGINSARLVSSRYHMHRASMEVKAQNPGLKIIIHPVTQGDIGVKNLYFWHVVFSEYHKTLLRWSALQAQNIFGKKETAIWF